MRSLPLLYPVIAAPTDAPPFVAPLPTPPWPPFVRLSEASTDFEVALVVAQLARYGHGGNGPQDLASLVRDFPRVTPGGLLAIDETHEVGPSCCCGLEAWRDWQQLISGGGQPWLGHDPSPWVETRGDELLVWSDGGLGEALPDDARPIRFSRAQLTAALADAERDLRGFAKRLRDWAARSDRKHAGELAEHFLMLVGVALL